jgi:hypothetical protein
MITITYSPTSIDDFERACKIVKELGLSTPSTSLVPVPRIARPSARVDNEAVNRYCQRRGLKKYMRTEAGVSQGLTAFEDLRMRAEQGEPDAIASLEQEDEMPDTLPENPNQEAPENGQAY